MNLRIGEDDGWFWKMPLFARRSRLLAALQIYLSECAR
jgi:hypothetical protein